MTDTLKRVAQALMDVEDEAPRGGFGTWEAWLPAARAALAAAQTPEPPVQLKVGDVLRPGPALLSTGSDPGTRRRILAVRQTGYDWEYADLPTGESNEFASENSSDPFFEWWELVQDAPPHG